MYKRKEFDKQSGEEIIWKKLYNFENYIISNFGQISSITRQAYNNAGSLCTYPATILKPRKTKKNDNLFIEVNLGFDEKRNKLRKTIYLQRAVADHFVPKPETTEELFSTHLDFDKTNNSYKNIIWVNKEYLTKLEQTTKMKNGTISYSSVLNK